MRRHLIFLGCLTLFFSLSARGTLITVSGDVSGTWDVDTVLVEAEIRVPPEATLVIEPGTEVLFQGYHKFIIDTDATLTAIGTELDSIRFDGLYWGIYWHGIRFYSASINCHLRCCIISHSYADPNGYNNDDCGGGVYAEYTSLTLENSTIEYCSSPDRFGGGLYLEGTSIPVISNNFIHDCFAISGGAIQCGENCDAEINSNFLMNNAAHGKAAGIYLSRSVALVENNIVIDNVSYDHCGGVYIFEGLPSLRGNLIVGNYCFDGAGCALEIVHSDAILTKNTIVENTCEEPTGTGGIYVNDCLPEITNCILWDNFPNSISGGNPDVTYCDIEGGWSGTGNFSLDPEFLAVEYGDYRLNWGSPCIDSGDPNSISDPDGTVPDIGYRYFNQSNPVTALITPHQVPAIIPYSGGTFSCTLHYINIDTAVQTADVWCDILFPDGIIRGPFFNIHALSLEPDEALSTDLTLSLEEDHEGGIYTVYGRAAQMADTSHDQFEVFKIPDPEIVLGVNEPNADSPHRDHAVPAMLTLEQNFPNPFNPVTTIRFTLVEPGDLSLTVYNLKGELITCLLTGYHPTGSHEFEFDGSGLPSGIYLYRLTTPHQQVHRKMILIQ